MVRPDMPCVGPEDTETQAGAPRPHRAHAFAFLFIPPGLTLGRANLEYCATEAYSKVSSQMTERSVPQVLFPTRGCAYPGECLALLGPSGAGKSTMLDMMSLRKTDGKIDGQVCANPLAPRRSVLEVKPHNFMDVI